MAEPTLPSINQFEEYLEKVLHSKQQTAKSQVVLANAKIEEVENLIRYLQRKMDSKETIGVRHVVDIGAEVFVEAEINDMSHVHVELVHGFYTTMLLSEAIVFLTERLEINKRRYMLALRQLAHCKTEIKCFLEALESRLFV